MGVVRIGVLVLGVGGCGAGPLDLESRGTLTVIPADAGVAMPGPAFGLRSGGGQLDLVAANGATRRMILWRGPFEDTTPAPMDLARTTVSSFASQDLNSDGFDDLIVVQPTNIGVAWGPVNADQRTFETVVSFGALEVQGASVRAADLTGDGVLDWILSLPASWRFPSNLAFVPGSADPNEVREPVGLPPSRDGLGSVRPPIWR